MISWTLLGLHPFFLLSFQLLVHPRNAIVLCSYSGSVLLECFATLFCALEGPQTHIVHLGFANFFELESLVEAIESGIYGFHEGGGFLTFLIDFDLAQVFEVGKLLFRNQAGKG